ncbi:MULTISPECIES: hypothetical protein [unclassified Oceanispirochaeta]|uniref:hypothetical protein n=1 Tax=unclassified Oceanispirochaeta TaxID=2635722 RepID=UPI000E096D26|nr:MULTISPECIES: hypothetical protein [unclassified Oceanispirochaeta]MBF9016360.1 hypothetical protein [Oceanispirochaeta sp. M2]NPD72822.1 hypothetical protein [Oceanispirochaeta sp. M1]RDG31666.1 hypothetical protein DV872_11990 [Oceanispirochaeta sp. M1]
MIRFFYRAVLAAGLFLSILSCGSNDGPTSPYTPETNDEDLKSWQEVLSEDPSYPDNVYLTAFIEWSPGVVGSSRQNGEYTDSEGRPLVQFTQDALGPPEGSGSNTSGDGSSCPLGINGWGIWQFDPGYVIKDGSGDDFITFTKTFAWGSTADGLCCELAFVEVSEDGTTWYKPAFETYDINPHPDTSNENYVYRNVSGLHGNEPSWANFRKDIQAEELTMVDGVEKWVEINGKKISRYFSSDDENLGGVRFDLSDFVLTTDSTVSWPSEGEMRYLKIIDDENILDGQDYAKDWSLGANLMAAMGINTAPAGGS